MGATRRFDGVGVDAARRYWRWWTWAKLHLTLLQAKGVPPDALGTAVLGLLGGPADMALEGLHIEDLSVPSGVDRMLECLDSQFLDVEDLDRTSATLDDVLRVSVEKGQGTAANTGRGRELFERAAPEEMEMPHVAGGLMLRDARPGT